MESDRGDNQGFPLSGPVSI